MNEREAVPQWVAPSNLIPTDCDSIRPEMLTLIELEQEQIDRIVQTAPGGSKNVQDIYPLSPLQEGMLFHNLLNEKCDTYVLSKLLELQSRPQLDSLIRALQRVIGRHEILRSAVLWEQLPEPVQVVYRRVLLPVTEIAIDRAHDSIAQLMERIAPQRETWDLRRAPLIKLKVAADVSSEKWYALLQIHHIICDHESLKILGDELKICIEERDHTLPDPVTYRNYVAGLKASLRTAEAESFFRRKLGDSDEPTAPFGLLNVQDNGGCRIREIRKTLEPLLASRVHAQALSFNVSTSSLFHAVLALVIARLSGRLDVVFGTVLLAGLRKNRSKRAALGMFVNTLPLRVRMQDATVRELVEQTQRELVELLYHGQTPLTVAQRCSGTAGRTPLFSALLNYRYSGPNLETDWVSADGIRVLATTEAWTNYPVALTVDDLGQEFVLTLQTDPRIDPHRTMEYICTATQSLVRALEEAPQTPVFALQILPEVEQRQVTVLFNETRVEYRHEKFTHQLFEEQVERTPEAVAVVYERQSLTYAELNCRANQLARALRAKGLGPDNLVALYVGRSLEMVVGVLGILKSGAAYVPLDPGYPIERLHYMLRDAEPRVLLIQEKLRARLPDTTAEIIALDNEWFQVARQHPGNLDENTLGLRPSHLAYVIYTSGSTGIPKGVAVDHEGLLNYLQWALRAYALEAGDAVPVSSPLAFDATVTSLYCSLLSGRSAVLLTNGQELEHLEQLLQQRRRWSLIKISPAHLDVLGQRVQSAELPSTVGAFVIGGEALPPSVVRLWRSIWPHIRLINEYGPTETVVGCSIFDIPRDWDDASSVPIGRPIANVTVYILDQHRQAVPIGVPGEIYIGGVGVARGYLNRPELTAERFIPDPFNSDPQARMYKTGDLGRWLANGTIEYLGRNDYQVKIRGFRIELGEVDAQLARHAQVKEAVVMAREDISGEKRLVAYVTSRDPPDIGVALSAETLRAHLMAVLPEYMIPSAFVMLESLPLTENGKLDRAALLALDLEAHGSRQYDSPKGQIEKTLATIWQELLQMERVGRQDNFFELGGHSLLALKLLFKINEEFGATLSVTDVYRSPSLWQLAVRLSGGMVAEKYVDLSQEARLADEIRVTSGFRNVPEKSVLLTGCTGFVGRFLLAQLLEETDSTVYCLIRARSPVHAMSRLKTTLEKWNLWKGEFERRVVAVPSDLSLPHLGVDEITYEILSETVDSIYHCATSMNHLETYAMAKQTNVDSTRELLSLATHRKPMLINHISTLDVFGRPQDDKIRFVSEESSIDHERHSNLHGYAASKWVSEKMIMKACERGIPCNIFRLGLVWADTRQGRYDELQREYRILKSCLLSGCGIKNYRYEWAPTPVDYVARSVVFLANRRSEGKGIFHISSSGQRVDGVFERCNEIAGASLKLMSLYEWISEIKGLHCNGRSMPVVPLIEYAFSMDEQTFYEHKRSVESGRIHFDCARTHRELELAGIVAPELDEGLLKVQLESMFLRDTQVRDWSTDGTRYDQEEGDARRISPAHYATRAEGVTR